ncbi:TerC family protein [Buchnera aphidicola]|uniref:TerC family protein n=1 Tax=Buchnera aphidicola (Sarucallis kahawaluokalani) TaxID=1241878 RepID=A0A4D6Y8M7_9GAMM|nr:TerC family protein [Buchnera aphidicola]QCI26017.1 TerC family protein [Buchnera aphidicola (Sarucallis kahawaluokalani)]
MIYSFNPTLLVGLITLILLEIVLNIDNLIFISILSGKLHPEQRNKARLIGLGLSFTLKLILLTIISWIITFNNPIFSNKYFNFSVHNIILLFGGSFLLIKSTIELYEKSQQYIIHNQYKSKYSGFWVTVLQIIIIDIIFSLDSVITAVGMIKRLLIMILAVMITTILMFIATKQLTKFINTHKKIIILCLILLLIIGCILILESFGIYISKNYIYITVGFTIITEFFNQTFFKKYIS